MENKSINTINEVEVRGRKFPHCEFILSSEALQFIVKLHEHFLNERNELLAQREMVQTRIDEGANLDFPEETAYIREANWRVAPIPNDIQDRRVEITGPVDAKMVINALNSGAKVFMADFEDSCSPTWENILEGQVNMFNAVRKTLHFKDEARNKEYKLNKETAVLFVRPRGLHLPEKNLQINGKPACASLVDFGLYFFHNAQEALNRGTAPYFYLPKLEHYMEARWWNEVFNFSQDYLNIPRGTIKATVLIETITAAFQLDEILFELKDHSAGLNCGRWDYIFSFIKRFKNRSENIFPDRALVNMEVPFMQAYAQRVISVCHKRGIHAMGGMAAQIPVKNNAEENDAAFEKVRKDKLREVTQGHDGTWVAHPGLIQLAMDVFNEHMPKANQVSRTVDSTQILAQHLVEVPTGPITEKGIRTNISVGTLYLAAWLAGNGAAAIHNLMEDAATAEISRMQLWQWVKYEALFNQDKPLTNTVYIQMAKEELSLLEQDETINPAWKEKLKTASMLFNEMVLAEEPAEFLTLKAYEHLS
ncbi:MAG: malate synthase A [Luteibaculaceae bacterium]